MTLTLEDIVYYRKQAQENMNRQRRKERAKIHVKISADFWERRYLLWDAIFLELNSSGKVVMEVNI